MATASFGGASGWGLGWWRYIKGQGIAVDGDSSHHDDNLSLKYDDSSSNVP